MATPSLHAEAHATANGTDPVSTGAVLNHSSGDLVTVLICTDDNTMPSFVVHNWHGTNSLVTEDETIGAGADGTVVYKDGTSSSVSYDQAKIVSGVNIYIWSFRITTGNGGTTPTTSLGIKITYGGTAAGSNRRWQVASHTPGLNESVPTRASRYISAASTTDSGWTTGSGDRTLPTITPNATEPLLVVVGVNIGNTTTGVQVDLDNDGTFESSGGPTAAPFWGLSDDLLANQGNHGFYGYYHQATSRTDSCTTTFNNEVVTDASITADDLGKPLSGTGIDTNQKNYVGTVTPGVSFLISTSPTAQFDGVATSSGTNNLTIGSTHKPGTTIKLHGTANWGSPNAVLVATYRMAPSSQNVEANLLTATPTVHTPAVQYTQNVTVALLSAAPTLFQPTVTSGQVVAPTLLNAAPTVFTPAVQYSQNAVPPLLDATPTIYEPAVANGYITWDLPDVPFTLSYAADISSATVRARKSNSTDIGEMQFSLSINGIVQNTSSWTALTDSFADYTLNTPGATGVPGDDVEVSISFRRLELYSLEAEVSGVSLSVVPAQQNINGTLLNASPTIYSPNVALGLPAVLVTTISVGTVYTPRVEPQTVSIAVLDASPTIFTPRATRTEFRNVVWMVGKPELKWTVGRPETKWRTGTPEN